MIKKQNRFLYISLSLFIIILLSEVITYFSFKSAGVIVSEIEILVMALGFLLPLTFFITTMRSYEKYSKINTTINKISSLWLIWAAHAFMAGFLTFILIMLQGYKIKEIPVYSLSQALMFSSFILTIWGIINAYNIRVVRKVVHSDHLFENWKNKKIALISDIHIGNLNHKKFAERIVKKLNKEKPDILFIAGDLIDGPCFPYKDWLSPFERINPPLGIYYITGNHETYNTEFENFKSSLPENINDITDKKIEINNTNIFGISYVENETGNILRDRLLKIGYDKNEPSIVLIHDPKNIKSLAKEDVDLVLSGHTHGGQFSPLISVIRMLYGKYNYGLTYTKNTASFTSCGVGLSMLPLRTGTVGEIVILEIR